jgi:hypothetical protein
MDVVNIAGLTAPAMIESSPEYPSTRARSRDRREALAVDLLFISRGLGHPRLGAGLGYDSILIILSGNARLWPLTCGTPKQWLTRSLHDSPSARLRPRVPVHGFIPAPIA